jgi:hypothetical protein
VSWQRLVSTSGLEKLPCPYSVEVQPILDSLQRSFAPSDLAGTFVFYLVRQFGQETVSVRVILAFRHSSVLYYRHRTALSHASHAVWSERVGAPHPVACTPSSHTWATVMFETAVRARDLETTKRRIICMGPGCQRRILGATLNGLFLTANKVSIAFSAATRFWFPLHAMRFVCSKAMTV